MSKYIAVDRREHRVPQRFSPIHEKPQQSDEGDEEPLDLEATLHHDNRGAVNESNVEQQYESDRTLDSKGQVVDRKLKVAKHSKGHIGVHKQSRTPQNKDKKKQEIRIVKNKEKDEKDEKSKRHKKNTDINDRLGSKKYMNDIGKYSKHGSDADDDSDDNEDDVPLLKAALNYQHGGK